jgi:hypothetical protein
MQPENPKSATVMRLLVAIALALCASDAALAQKDLLSCSKCNRNQARCNCKFCGYCAQSGHDQSNCRDRLRDEREREERRREEARKAREQEVLRQQQEEAARRNREREENQRKRQQEFEENQRKQQQEFEERQSKWKQEMEENARQWKQKREEIRRSQLQQQPQPLGSVGWGFPRPPLGAADWTPGLNDHGDLEDADEGMWQEDLSGPRRTGRQQPRPSVDHKQTVEPHAVEPHGGSSQGGLSVPRQNYAAPVPPPTRSARGAYFDHQSGELVRPGTASSAGVTSDSSGLVDPNDMGVRVKPDMGFDSLVTVATGSAFGPDGSPRWAGADITPDVLLQACIPFRGEDGQLDRTATAAYAHDVGLIADDVSALGGSRAAQEHHDYFIKTVDGSNDTVTAGIRLVKAFGDLRALLGVAEAEPVRSTFSAGELENVLGGASAPAASPAASSLDRLLTPGAASRSAQPTKSPVPVSSNLDKLGGGR